MLMISRYDIVARTVQKLRELGIDPNVGPGNVDPDQQSESEQRTVERLTKRLEITHGADNYQISVGMHANSPRNLAEILNCLTETFIEVAKSEEFDGEDRRIKTLNSERSRLQAELDRDLQTRSDIARGLGVSNFEQLPADRLVEATRSSLDQARRERIEAEAEVSLLERDASLAGTLAVQTPPPQIDTTENAGRERLEERREQVKGLLAGLKPKHPEYPALANELARLDEQLKEIPKPKVREVRQFSVPSPSNELLNKARIELERARKAEAELNLELSKDIAKVDSTAGDLQRGRDLEVRIEQVRTQINAIDDRLSYFRVEANAPGFLRVASPARTPLSPEKSSRNKYLAVLFALALAMSIGTVVLIDMTHAKIFTMSDVNRILGFPPLGVLLLRSPETRYFAQEQFARMVNSIEHVFRRSGARVFVFTPVGVQASDSRLVDKIARELQARRIRAVVLPVSGLNRNSPVTETRIVTVPIAGDLEELQASDRRRTGALGLKYVRDNGEPDAPLHSVSGFAGMIEEMTLVHDLVLVDAAPLLMSADTEYLTTLAAVTFLTVEAGKVSVADLKRAASLMERLRPTGIAAILHGVSLKLADSQLRRRCREFEACRKNSQSYAQN
jgi:uncharacterized protein involved in exopolysaccharide biosynthesis